jgi:hypothetical protein
MHDLQAHWVVAAAAAGKEVADAAAAAAEDAASDIAANSATHVWTPGREISANGKTFAKHQLQQMEELVLPAAAEGGKLVRKNADVQPPLYCYAETGLAVISTIPAHKSASPGYIAAWRRIQQETNLEMGDPAGDRPIPNAVWVPSTGYQKKRKTLADVTTPAPTTAKKAKPIQKTKVAKGAVLRRNGPGKGVAKANSATATPIVPSCAPPVPAHVPQPVNDTNPNCAAANGAINRPTFQSATTPSVLCRAPASHVPAHVPQLVSGSNPNCVAVNVVVCRPTFQNPLFRVLNVQQPFVHSVYMSDAVVDGLCVHANHLELDMRVPHAEETVENIAVLTALADATLNTQAPCIKRIVTISITL